jgi:uncharacterized protein DUF4296
MIRILYFIGVMVCLTSCYNVNESVVVVPEKLFSKSKMVEVLTDVQLVEAGLSINENRSYEMELKPKYYKLVLETHNISLKELKDNINYYQSNPKVMEEIYESVLANLSKLQSEVLIEVEDFENSEDSIALIKDSLDLISKKTIVK